MHAEQGTDHAVTQDCHTRRHYLRGPIGDAQTGLHDNQLEKRLDIAKGPWTLSCMRSSVPLVCIVGSHEPTSTPPRVNNSRTMGPSWYHAAALGCMRAEPCQSLVWRKSKVR